MAERNQSIWKRIRGMLTPTREPDYIKDQPEAIRSFMKRFKAESEQQEALYNLMKTSLEKGQTTLDNQHAILAKIGDAELLRYMYEEYAGTKDAHIRKLILENPACPEDVTKKAFKDKDWEVRKAAMMRADVPDLYVKSIAKHETHPMVQAALKERLGEQCPSFNEKTVLPAVGKALIKPSLGSRIQSAEMVVANAVKANPITHERISQEYSK